MEQDLSDVGILKDHHTTLSSLLALKIMLQELQSLAAMVCLPILVLL
jgi:hypothetical protein